MRRMVWVAVGAAGGIVVYRRAVQVLAEAREKGVVVSAQQIGVSAASALSAARMLAAGAVSAADTRDRGEAPPAPGAAAARVLRQSKQGE
jgi:transcription initiation factor TFIIIB Brf1 subunit/transcription initiation factor TFIIB